MPRKRPNNYSSHSSGFEVLNLHIISTQRGIRHQYATRQSDPAQRTQPIVLFCTYPAYTHPLLHR